MDGVELGVSGLGLGRALGGLEPEDLQIGEGGAELLFGEELAVLELAEDRHELMAEPALLGVSTEQQTDVGEGIWIGVAGHVERPCLREWLGGGWTSLRTYLRLRLAIVQALEFGMSFHASRREPPVVLGRAQVPVVDRSMGRRDANSPPPSVRS